MERQLQFGCADRDVWKVKQVDLQRIKQSLAGDDELFRLLLDGKRSDQGRYFFGGLPFRKLTESLLPSPDTCMNDLQEELARPGVEDEDCSVDWLRCQVALESLVDGHAIDVGIIDEQLGLVAEQLRIVLGVQELLVALRCVQLQALTYPFPQDIQGRIGLHNLCHSLLHEQFQTREILSVGGVEIVCQIDADHEPSGRGIQTHAIRCVVKILGSDVSLNVVRVVVTVAELNVNPELVGRG